MNRRKKVKGQPEADFFRVSAWGERGKVCNQYLDKGKKVSVVGPVRVHTYTNSNGETKASMEVFAEDVEFLTPKGDGFTPVQDEDCPWG